MGDLPFGFRLAADGEYLEPDPAEQAALLEIDRLRHQGESVRKGRYRVEPTGLPDARAHAA